MCVHSENYHDFTIEIGYDSHARNPLKEFDNMSKIACSQSRSTLGDLHFDDRIEMLLDIANLDYLQADWFTLASFVNGFDAESYLLKKIKEKYIYIDDYDLFSFVTKTEVRKQYNCKRISPQIKKLAESVLAAELATLKSWGEGEVYYYVIKDETGLDIDSCFGFYGNNEIHYMCELAKSQIDDILLKRRKDHLAKVKAWIVNKVPLIYRRVQLV